MKKKLLSMMLCAAMVMVFLGGCGKDVGDGGKNPSEDETSKNSDESGEKTTITMWTVFTGSDGDILKEIIKKYNETNEENIKVEIDIMDGDTLQTKLPTAISTGTGPDFVLQGIEFIEQYAKNDLILDISDFWETMGINQSNYFENVVAKSYVGDKLYGVPMQYNLQYLYYNKDLFQAAGLDPEQPPKTLQELGEYAQKLTDSSKNQYGIGFPMDYNYYCEYLWGNGGDVINEDGTENKLNSQENIDTLKWIQNLAVDKKVSPQGLTATDADTMFQSGQLAMYTSGPWNINGLKDLGVNFGITGIPAGTAGAYSPEGGCSYMIPTGVSEEKKEAIYKWMAYWISDDVLKEWSNRNGFPVWSNSLMEDTEIKSNDILNSVSNASIIGRDWHLGLEIGSQIDKDVMQPMIEQVLSGTEVTKAVEDASKLLDGIVSEK
ncbi:MAG: ABC transporter substrate-binding protein [Lachnospiraceae bacterium]